MQEIYVKFAIFKIDSEKEIFLISSKKFHFIFAKLIKTAISKAIAATFIGPFPPPKTKEYFEAFEIFMFTLHGGTAGC